MKFSTRTYLRLLCTSATVLLATYLAPPKARAQSTDLSGAGWTFKTVLEAEPTFVSVPYSWPADEKYRHYLGTAIFERDFDAAAVPDGKVAFLHFDAVYNKAQVWLNGKRLGEHAGGYTPFEFDVTQSLRPGRNHLLVEVNNAPSLETIPALAPAAGSSDHVADGSLRQNSIVGWLPYGGIVRPVRLDVRDTVFLRAMKIEAKPNFATGDAALYVRAWVQNAGPLASGPATVRGIVGDLVFVLRSAAVQPGQDAVVEWSGTLRHAHLWSVRDPYLYTAKLTLGTGTLATKIGVREVRVQGTELMLNGKPIHLFGANRVSEDPLEGLTESDSIVQRDLSDMLALNMRMMRMAHYPLPPAILDFADAHGMLLIPEAGNWNMAGWQMADPTVRAVFQKQMKEMVERDWNHPSVIAWSVGNEFESWSKGGIDWTRDMRSFTLSLDPTRLITFASRFTSDPAVKTGKDEASQYSDFVSINVYGDYGKRFDRAHELYPDKPIFVTEFGKTGEPGLHDPQRIAAITGAVEAMKARPWIIGGSLWTWADYRSFYRGTPASGIRYWGVVNLEREHRDSWQAVQKLFAAELP
jgi:beta-glucuronidase